jgi:hypothetical protein
MTKARDLANAATSLSDVTPTELSYLDGVTSNIQTQVNNLIAAEAQVNKELEIADIMDSI